MLYYGNGCIIRSAVWQIKTGGWCHRSCSCWTVSSRSSEVPRTSSAVASLSSLSLFSLGSSAASPGGWPGEIKDGMDAVFFWKSSKILLPFPRYLWLLPLAHHSCNQQLLFLVGVSAPCTLDCEKSKNGFQNGLNIERVLSNSWSSPNLILCQVGGLNIEKHVIINKKILGIHDHLLGKCLLFTWPPCSPSPQVLAQPSKQQRPKFGQSPSGWPGDQHVDT